MTRSQNYYKKQKILNKIPDVRDRLIRQETLWKIQLVVRLFSYTVVLEDQILGNY